eukprot:gb/GECG01003493.1/.p1 GENE.gb/GECG01003493.1/~~gb/GECG01003493.1/.p1  ORF type:complete len:254 (+),score=28.26 gb/GECG01003493.1/:1-762(+)
MASSGSPIPGSSPPPPAVPSLSRSTDAQQARDATSQPQDDNRTAGTVIPPSKRRMRLQFAEGDETRKNNFVVELGMQMLGNFTERMLSAGNEDNGGQATLRCIDKMMSGREPQEFFGDWSPPRSLPLQPIPSDEITLSASSTDPNGTVDKMLAGPGCKAWISDKAAGQGSHIQAVFPECPVGGISFAFPSKNRGASEVEVLLRQGDVWTPLGLLEGEKNPVGEKGYFSLYYNSAFRQVFGHQNGVYRIHQRKQ